MKLSQSPPFRLFSLNFSTWHVPCHASQLQPQFFCSAACLNDNKSAKRIKTMQMKSICVHLLLSFCSLGFFSSIFFLILFYDECRYVCTQPLYMHFCWIAYCRFKFFWCAMMLFFFSNKTKVSLRRKSLTYTWSRVVVVVVKRFCTLEVKLFTLNDPLHGLGFLVECNSNEWMLQFLKKMRSGKKECEKKTVFHGAAKMRFFLLIQWTA